MSRIYRQSVEIDVEKTRLFFENRAKNSLDNKSLSITMYQDSEIAEQRNNVEKEILEQFGILKLSDKVLDIGCGIGRWAKYFQDKISAYLGIDYSENLISLAQENNLANNVFFQKMSLVDIKKEALILDPPYNIFIICAVLFYVNDGDVFSLVERVNDLAGNDSYIYIREPISILEHRLTLKDYYSEELKAEYNAIYRTDLEYKNFFAQLKGFEVVNEDFLYDKSLHSREETRHKYYLLRKKK